jgi:CheY-like chemotaxis protein
MKILIAEDEPAFRHLLEEKLTKCEPASKINPASAPKRDPPESLTNRRHGQRASLTRAPFVAAASSCEYY